MSTDFSLPRAVHAAISASPTGQVSRLKLASDLNVSELVLRDSLEPHVTANIFTCRRGPAAGRDSAGPLLYGKGPWFAAAHFRAGNPEPAEVATAPSPAAGLAGGKSLVCDPVQVKGPGKSTPAPIDSPAPTAPVASSRKIRIAVNFDALVPRKGIPLPPSGSGNPGESKWAEALSKLDIGDSYVFPEGTEPAVSKAAKTYGKRTNKQFRIRKIVHEGKPAVGLWRIEDLKPGANL